MQDFFSGWKLKYIYNLQTAIGLRRVDQGNPSSRYQCAVCVRWKVGTIYKSRLEMKII